MWGLVPFGEGKEPLSKSYEHFQIDSNEQKTGEKQRNLRFTDVFLQSTGISAAAGHSQL